MKKDWWKNLRDTEKVAIEKSLAEADRGELIPHEEVMKDIKEKYIQ